MRIDRNDRIAGLPILRIRNFLRMVRQPNWGGWFNKQDLVSYLKVSERKALEIIRELRARRWIEPGKHKWIIKERGFELTMEGDAFTIAHAMPPISRAKGEHLLGEFLKRVEAANQRDELSHYVREAWVFGSFLKAGKRLRRHRHRDR